MKPQSILLSALVVTAFLPPCRAGEQPLSDAQVQHYLEVYRELHAHPEVSYHERESAARLAEGLRSYGFDVTTGIGRYPDPELEPHGLVGVLRNGDGPVVWVRADMDALPVEEKTGLPYASRVRVETAEGVPSGVMHACGHDVHMTVFLATARALSERRGSWQGTLVMLGQPAEERGAGARAMLADGLYSKYPRPDYVLALHVNAELPAGVIGYRPGYVLAGVDSVDIRVFGEGGHGAYPHLTRDPVVAAAQLVTALQTIVSRTVSPLDPAVVTVGSIRGGTKHNIIPDFVDLQLTVRSYRPEVRLEVLDSIRRIAAATAQAAGLSGELAPTVEVSEDEHTPATYNDPDLTARLARLWKEELGEEQVVEVEPVMAGEDFSRYSLDGHVIPTSLFWLGSVPLDLYERESDRLPPLHSSRFAPDPEPTIRTGVWAMTAAVLELLQE